MKYAFCCPWVTSTFASLTECDYPQSISDLELKPFSEIVVFTQGYIPYTAHYEVFFEEIILLQN